VWLSRGMGWLTSWGEVVGGLGSEDDLGGEKFEFCCLCNLLVKE